MFPFDPHHWKHQKKLLDQKGTLERNVLMPFYNGQMILIFLFFAMYLERTNLSGKF